MLMFTPSTCTCYKSCLHIMSVCVIAVQVVFLNKISGGKTKIPAEQLRSRFVLAVCVCVFILFCRRNNS